MNEKRFYVYKHVDPKTGELLYVGKGSGQRAWMCMGGYDDVHYGHRSREHTGRLVGLMNEGYLPCDWVVVVKKGMSNSEAVRFEQGMVRELRPMFNRPMGRKLLRLGKEQIREARRMYNDGGVTYQELAGVFGVGAMTVHRALNGTNKNREVGNE